MYSFKISSHVSFPLEGLNMQPFLAKDSPSQVATYDLLSVICHHGTAGSMRYYHFLQLWARTDLLRLSCAFLLIQVDTTLLTVRMWSTANGTSSMTSMWQKSMRRLCRMQKPMCCSTGKRWKASSNLVGAVFFVPAWGYWLCFMWIFAERAVRSRCGSGRKSWPWPVWRSPACCSFTSPENGWTSSTRSLNQAPSATTHFFASMEVHIRETRHVNMHILIPRHFFCAGIPPNKYHYIDDLVVIVPQNVWEYLYNR